MMRRRISAMVVLLSFMVLGAMVCQPANAPTALAGSSEQTSMTEPSLAGYDSPNMTVVLVTPANQSTLVGPVNITLLITSVNGPLNLTLFVDGDIYSPYNKTLIGTGQQNMSVDTIALPDGNLNFTLLFENSSFTPVDRETYYLRFTVNNHGPPAVVILWPGVDDIFTGLANLTLNITSDYSYVYMNVTVAGEITPEFNSTMVLVGAGNFTINGSRYENGQNIVRVKVWTEEGLSASAERSVNFLDYVRLNPVDITRYARVYGNYEIKVRIDSPLPNVTLSVYVDGVVASDVENITIATGTSAFTINTTMYSEGEHNFTYKAYDGLGHVWVFNSWYTVDNHGAPAVQFVLPEQDVVHGIASFTVNIDTTWQWVNLTVYVDGVPVEGLINVTVAAGDYTFSLDSASYTKWQHDVKIVVITQEDLTGETEKPFGFASIRTEEILSLVLLLGVAFAIPLVRKARGQSIRIALLVDAIFLVVVFGLFIALGVNSIPLMFWHLNLASIWAIGSALVFVNWVLPIVVAAEATESE